MANDALVFLSLVLRPLLGETLKIKFNRAAFFTLSFKSQGYLVSLKSPLSMGNNVEKFSFSSFTLF